MFSQSRIEVDTVRITSKTELVELLADLGYKIDESLSFNYVNNLNPGPSYKARAVSIVQADDGSSFAHVDARRDDNFRRLQALRFNQDILIRGRVWEI